MPCHLCGARPVKDVTQHAPTCPLVLSQTGVVVPVNRRLLMAGLVVSAALMLLGAWGWAR